MALSRREIFGVMQMKKCFKCGEVKELSSFYRHRMMADGHLNKCKDCTKRDVRENRNRRADYYREYERMRFQRDEHRRERNSEYQKTPEGKMSISISRKMYIKRSPEKRAAHIILGSAVRRGDITKPDKCSRCGCKPTKSRNLHGHHHDYYKPLDVEWLCVWCHAEEHWPNEFRHLREKNRE